MIKKLLRSLALIVALLASGGATAESVTLGSLIQSLFFGPTPPTLSSLGFAPIGKLSEETQWLNFERIGWLYTSHTGKEPDYQKFIMNGEYMQKGARQIPQFCQMNRWRFAVCEYMRTNQPHFLDQYTQLSKAGIEAVRGQHEFYMNGVTFEHRYDRTKKGQPISYDGVRGGIVLGTGCWFSHSESAPHACINIDNYNSIGKAVLPIRDDPEASQLLVRNAAKEDYQLVMKVRLKSPFYPNKLYKRGNYGMFGSTGLYTAWVIATNVYLVDKDGNIYYDIPIAADYSEQDRIDAEEADMKRKGIMH